MCHLRQFPGIFFALSLLLVTCLTAGARGRGVVVADSLTLRPLAGVSLFSNSGHMLGISDKRGHFYGVSAGDFPLRVRLMGYYEKSAPDIECDTILLAPSSAQLPEVTVEAKTRTVLHMLAYIREYSTLATYTDTVTMFREKMVDYMIPTEMKSKFKGWHRPRVLNSRSYYHFTNGAGRDSVSDQCNQHFTWTDWIGMLPNMPIPVAIAGPDSAEVAIAGRYGTVEEWRREADRISVDIDILADTTSHRWVSTLSSFFHRDDVDFERFSMKVNYDNVLGDDVSPLELSGYSFNIESRGRGIGMFMFNREDQPIFVTSYTEVYITDREFITVKEARKWERKTFADDEIPILEPAEAPGLQPSVIALIDRVSRINPQGIRLALAPDHRLVGRNVYKANFSIAHRALDLLKQLTGITSYKFHKNFNRNWSDFTRSWRSRHSP